MQTKSQTKTKSQSKSKSRKHARVNRTYGAAQMERFGNYIISLDDTRGGYTYGDDYNGDDLRALCDIFGA